MPARARWSRLPIIGLVMMLTTAATARADTIAFSAELSGAAQVPVNPSKGKGAAIATYDTATKVLRWSGSYTGTTSQPIAFHFHGPADATKNGPVVVNIEKFASPFEGQATLTEAQAADLLAGLWYLNLHTPSYPGGELRGQVVGAKAK